MAFPKTQPIYYLQKDYGNGTETVTCATTWKEFAELKKDYQKNEGGGFSKLVRREKVCQKCGETFDKVETSKENFSPEEKRGSLKILAYICACGNREEKK